MPTKRLRMAHVLAAILTLLIFYPLPSFARDYNDIYNEAIVEHFISKYSGTCFIEENFPGDRYCEDDCGGNFSKFGEENNPTWAAAGRLEAFVDMYERTKDVRFMGILKCHIDQALDGMDVHNDYVDEVRNQHGLYGWGRNRHASIACMRHVWVVEAGNLIYPIAAFIRFVYLDDTLHDQFKEDADRYRENVIKIIGAMEPDYVHSGIYGKGYYKFPAGMKDLKCEEQTCRMLGVKMTKSDIKSCENFAYIAQKRGKIKALPFNMNTAMAKAWLELYHADPERKFYKKRIERMVKFYKDNLVIKVKNGHEHYQWRYIVDGRLEDAEHGAGVMRFVKKARQMGFDFASADMNRFARTFSKIMVHRHKDGKAVRLADRVDGYINWDKKNRTKRRNGFCRAAALWLALSETMANQPYHDAMSIYRYQGYPKKHMTARQFSKFYRWKPASYTWEELAAFLRVEVN